jgi:chondroitin 4-sulfotransferase 11
MAVKEKLISKSKIMVLRSKVHKFIWYIVPKVASSTIRWTVHPFVCPHMKCSRPLTKTNWNNQYSHITNANLNSHFSFAFVRNPWDRIVSVYAAQIAPRSSRGPQRFESWNLYNRFMGQKIFYCDMDFAEFVRELVKIPQKYANRHFRSQAALLTFNKKLRPNFIGKLENFQEDWQVIRDNIPGMPNLVEDNINKTNHAPFESFYTPELRDLVGEKYKMDIKLFGYKK